MEETTKNNLMHLAISGIKNGKLKRLINTGLTFLYCHLNKNKEK